MTAPIVFASSEATAIGSLFRTCATEKTSQSATTHRVRSTSSQLSNKAHPGDAPALSLIQSSLLESLHQGVIVTSRSLKPLYWNARGRLLCQHLTGGDVQPLELPTAVSEMCRRLMRDERLGDRPLILECQTATGQTIRMNARWLHLPDDRATQQPYILILLENCNDLLQEEVRIERKKYDLTEREAEVWMLLRQEYSYQDVAKLLQISLNTVKTHVKNVYAKKRSCQGREKFWCGD
ncbi:MAG: helix-turn-helix transcriptional regulator [Stenomitos frigidus ULC029]